MKFNLIQKIYVICETGALGDTIATFPILKILAERGHIEKMFVDERFYPLYKMVFPQLLLVSLKEALCIIPKEEVTSDIPSHVINPRTGEASFLRWPLIPGIPVVSTMSTAGLMPIHASLVDSFSATIGNALLKEDQKDYPFVAKDRLPGNPCRSDNYVVISYGSTTEHRKMTPEAFIGVRDYFLSRGFDVVLLGKSDHQLMVKATGELAAPSFEGLEDTGCINLIDKTTIEESLSVLHDAKCLVGVDGGLVHLAGMTDVPIVGGFTSVDPYYRTIYRHTERGWKFYPVEPDSECRYCQTETFCTYGVFFHVCNTKTFECMNSLTAEKWIAQIELALQ